VQGLLVEHTAINVYALQECPSRDISLMKRQFVVTHIFRQSENPALLDSLVTHANSVKILCPQQIACPYIFINT
jgi:hypothetical protein